MEGGDVRDGVGTLIFVVPVRDHSPGTLTNDVMLVGRGSPTPAPGRRCPPAGPGRSADRRPGVRDLEARTDRVLLDVHGVCAVHVNRLGPVGHQVPEGQHLVAADRGRGAHAGRRHVTVGDRRGEVSAATTGMGSPSVVTARSGRHARQRGRRPSWPGEDACWWTCRRCRAGSEPAQALLGLLLGRRPRRGQRWVITGGMSTLPRPRRAGGWPGPPERWVRPRAGGTSPRPA